MFLILLPFSFLGITICFRGLDVGCIHVYRQIAPFLEKGFDYSQIFMFPIFG